jgi:sugar phosphate isomerase/epimerase
MKISMGSWSFSFGPYAEAPVSLEDAARRLASAGFDGIELGGYVPHVTLEAYASPESRAALRRFLSDLGLRVSGYAADIGAVNPTVPGKQAAYVDLFRRQLELAVDLGSPTLRVDTVAAPGSIRDEDYRTTLCQVADAWRECAEFAREAQVRMVWEFEPGYVFNKPSEVVAMHDRVGHPWFQILFDTGHAYMCGVMGVRQHGKREVLEGGIEKFLDLLAGRIGAVHVVDSDGTLYMDETSTHVPFGAGCINWGHVAAKLRAVPHVEWWCIDLSFCPRAWELVAPSLEFVRGLVGGASPSDQRP